MNEPLNTFALAVSKNDDVTDPKRPQTKPSPTSAKIIFPRRFSQREILEKREFSQNFGHFEGFTVFTILIVFSRRANESTAVHI